jgi:hypothetical protein
VGCRPALLPLSPRRITPEPRQRLSYQLFTPPNIIGTSYQPPTIPYQTDLGSTRGIVDVELIPEGPTTSNRAKPKLGHDIVNVEHIPDEPTAGCLSRRLDEDSRDAIYGHNCRAGAFSCPIAEAVLSTLYTLHHYAPTVDSMGIKIDGIAYLLSPHAIASLAPGDLLYSELLDMYLHQTLKQDNPNLLSFPGFNASSQILRQSRSTAISAAIDA